MTGWRSPDAISPAKLIVVLTDYGNKTTATKYPTPQRPVLISLPLFLHRMHLAKV
jgi:hypothetical protein